MRTLLLITLMFMTLKTFGQNHFVGVTGGILRADAASSNFLDNVDSRIAMSGGITYEYFFKNLLSLGADLVYIQRGFEDNIEVADQGATIKYYYDYIAVPIKVGFTRYVRDQRIFSFVKAGLTPSLLVNAETTFPVFTDTGVITGSRTEDVSDRVTDFDLGGLVEIGAGHNFMERLWLTFSIAYQHSFTSLTNSQYFRDSEIRHNAFSLNLALKWALKSD